MKRYCKDVDILDFEFLQFCAAECLRKKWKRRDVLEYFSGLTGRSKEEILYAIKNGEKPGLVIVAAHHKFLLVTFRTKDEGGEVPLTHKEYLDFINTVIDADCADLIDIEFFTAGDDICELIDNAHSSGVVVVCSSHDFQKTPDKNELVSRMVKMQQVGADLPKVAVMPHDSTDVLVLLSATVEMRNKYFATPIITISMGKLGVASRLCGEMFGSAMTFASAGDSSAPGQVRLDIVNAVLDSITE